MDKLSAIQSFTSVVENGSFTAAAHALGQSKSSISKQIAHLEEHLGVRLLNRTTRRMSPTEVGRAFYERARQVVLDLDEAERAVTDLHANPHGTLRINAPMSFGTRYVAPEVSAFMKRYPDISIDLELSDRVVDVVDEGFDMAIRITKLPDSSLIARKLAPFRRAICASPGYWEQHGRPQTPAELRHHNCLLYTYLLSGNEWTFGGPHGTQHVRVAGNFTANNGDALLSAAREGLGVLSTPTFIGCDDLKSGQLESVLHDYDDVAADIYAIYPHSRHLSAKVRLFVDFLVEHYGPQPPWDVTCDSAAHTR